MQVRRIRKFLALLLPLLPHPLRRRVACRLLGWEIHPTARLGRSRVEVRMLRMGPRAVIGHRNVITGLEELSLGREARIGGGNRIIGYYGDTTPFPGDPPRRSALLMGEFAQITTDHKIDCCDTVEMEPYAVLAGFATVVLTHSLDLETNSWRLAPVRVGDHAIVMSNCTLFLGTTIAPQAAVSAGSIVSRSLEEPATLYAGNPAEPVRELDPAEFKLLSRTGHFGEGDVSALG